MNDPDDMIVTMPKEAKMLEALRSVLDEPHVCEHLYPLVCEQLASQQKMAVGVVMGLMLALHDYLEELPDEATRSTRIPITGFITAITPQPIRADALEYWENIRSRLA